MKDKRLRHVIKEEPDSSGDQQQQQQQVAPRRRKEEGGAGDLEREARLLKMNADFQAFAFQAMEQKRAMDEKLLRLEVEIAQLRAESKLQQAIVQCKDAEIEWKAALIRRLQSDAGIRSAAAAAASLDRAPAPPASSLGRYSAPGKHVVSSLVQKHPPHNPTPAFHYHYSVTPPPPSHPPFCQRYKEYIYATAHAVDVDGWDCKPGSKSDDIDACFKVAPGDASDIEVTNAHPWSCEYLVFSDGRAAGTALGISGEEWAHLKGKPRFVFKSMNMQL
jgi:hypothetical protein